MNRFFPPHPAVAALLLAACTFLLYLPATRYGWISLRDDAAVKENPFVYTGLDLANARWSFTHARDGAWQPLTAISHMATCERGGLSPRTAHLANILLHTFNAALVLLLLHTMTGALGRSAATAALFAWHPLNVEAVAWIANRDLLLATFFGLLALAAYIRHSDSPSWGRLLPVLVLFGLSALSSPAFATFPLLLLLLDAWPLGRIRSSTGENADTIAFSQASFGRLTIEKAPLFVIAALCTAIACVALARDPLASAGTLSFFLRVETSLVAAATQLGQILFPAHLPLLSPLPTTIPAWKAIATLAVLAGLTVFAFLVRRSRPWLTTGWLWYLVALVPTFSLVSGLNFLASRHAYIPLIGIVMALVWTVAHWAGQIPWRRRTASTLASLALAACLVLSTFQLRHWKDSETLFSHVIARYGPTDFAVNGLALALLEKDDTRGALRTLEHSRQPPIDEALEVTLAHALSKAGNSAEARSHAEAVLARAPNYAPAHYVLGIALTQEKEFGAALHAFNKAIGIRGRYPDAMEGMGAVCLEQGIYKPALQNMEKALAQKPHSAEFQNNLAWLLATCPESPMRSGTRAVLLATQACSASQSNASYLDTLAAAYAESRRFEDALSAIRKAIDMAQREGNTSLLPEMAARQKLYEQRMPFQMEDPSGRP